MLVYGARGQVAAGLVKVLGSILFSDMFAYFAIQNTLRCCSVTRNPIDLFKMSRSHSVKNFSARN